MSEHRNFNWKGQIILVHFADRVVIAENEEYKLHLRKRDYNTYIQYVTMRLKV